MGLGLAVMNAFMARRRDFPVEAPVALRALPGITIRAVPALLMPVILLTGIYGGVTTPTEAAALAAAYAFLISVVLYRAISARQARASVLASARSTAAVGLLIAGALVFNYVVTIENVPAAVQRLISGLELSQAGFILIVNLVLLALGCLLEGTTILLVVVPVLLPSAQALGLDPVHFGVMVVVNIMIGLVTPPFGLLLFVVANITRTPLGALIREIWPFILALITALLIIAYVPAIVLWLPRLYGYGG
jgi:tripartite ATP-independent transporter DctM subunit